MKGCWKILTPAVYNRFDRQMMFQPLTKNHYPDGIIEYVSFDKAYIKVLKISTIEALKEQYMFFGYKSKEGSEPYIQQDIDFILELNKKTFPIFIVLSSNQKFPDYMIHPDENERLEKYLRGEDPISELVQLIRYNVDFNGIDVEIAKESFQKKQKINGSQLE